MCTRPSQESLKGLSKPGPYEPSKVTGQSSFAGQDSTLEKLLGVESQLSRTGEGGREGKEGPGLGVGVVRRQGYTRCEMSVFLHFKITEEGAPEP